MSVRSNLLSITNPCVIIYKPTLHPGQYIVLSLRIKIKHDRRLVSRQTPSELHVNILVRYSQSGQKF